MRYAISILTGTILLVVLPSLASATAVYAIVPRGGTAARPGNEMLAPDLAKGKKSSGSSKNRSALDDNYVERIVQSQWQKHRRWSSVAAYRRRIVRGGRVSKLGLVSMGAVCQIAATQITEYKSTISCFGGLCIMLGSYIKNQVLTDEALDRWVNSFITSQAIKAEVIKFRTQVKPYAEFQKKPDKTLNLLRERCNRLSDSTNDPKFDVTGHDNTPVPGWMNTAEDYMTDRIDDMIDRFYKKEGRKLLRRSWICSHTENALLFVSAVASGSSTVQLPGLLENIAKNLRGWTGAATTVSAAFANHMAKGQFKEIALKYFDAADQLREIRDSWPSTARQAGSVEWEKQVKKSEDTIISTVEEWAKAKKGKENFHLQMVAPVRKSMSGPMVWQPEVMCGTDETGFYPAKDRVKWLMNEENMSKKDAQTNVMEEFPEKFQSI